MGDIVNRLILRGDQFDRTLNASGQKVKQFGDTIGRVAALIAASFVVRAIGGAITKLTDFGDRLDKTSRQLGLTANEVGALRFVLERAGVPADNLGKTMGLLTKNLLDFERGVGEAKFELEALGFEASDASRLLQDPTNAFIEIGTAINAIPDAGRRSATFLRILGRSGLQIAPAFDEGREALEALLVRYGELAGDQTALAANSAAYKDAVTDLEVAFTGLQANALGPLLPSLTTLLNVLADLASKTPEFTSAITGSLNEIVQKLELLTVGKAADSFGERIEGIFLAFRRFSQTNILVVETIGQALAAVVSGNLEGLADIPRKLREGRIAIEQEEKRLRFFNENAKFQPEAKKIVAERSTGPGSSSTVEDKRKQSESEGLQILIEQRNALIALIQEEEKISGIQSDRVFQLRDEIALIQKAADIAKERESAESGKRAVNNAVLITAELKKQASLLANQQEFQESIGKIQEALGQDIVAEAIANFDDLSANLRNKVEAAQLEFERKSRTFGATDQAIESARFQLVDARVNLLKSEIELNGKNAERTRDLVLLETERKSIQDELVKTSRDLQLSLQKDLDAFFNTERLDDLRGAVNEARADLQAGEINSATLPETQRLRRIDLLKAEISLLKERRSLGDIGQQDFQNEFHVLNTQLREENKDSQRGFAEGWSEALNKFVNDAQGDFGLAQVLVRSFAQSTQQTLQTTIFDFIEGRITTLADLGRGLLTTLNQIVAQAASVALTQQILQGAAGATSFFSTGGGSGGTSAGASVGGFLLRAGGGLIPGSGNTDSVPTLLTPGEGVLNRQGVQALGRLNNGLGLNGDGSVQVKIAVINNGKNDVSVQQERGRNGNEIKIFIEDIVSNSVFNGKVGNSISTAFGTQRRGT